MADKLSVLSSIEKQIRTQGLEVISRDFERPWGGFFVLDEGQIDEFTETYFPGKTLDMRHGPKSPKILVVAPGEELSWQYHYRRAEIWKIVAGPVGVKTSESDTQPDAARVIEEGELVSFDAETRHRLIGLEAVWGVVAEIWQHTNPAHLSDESDIVRLDDRYKRS